MLYLYRRCNSIWTDVMHEEASLHETATTESALCMEGNDLGEVTCLSMLQWIQAFSFQWQLLGDSSSTCHHHHYQ